MQKNANANAIDAPGSMFLQYLKTLRVSFELFGLRGRSGAVDGRRQFQEAMDAWDKLRLLVKQTRDDLAQVK